MSLHGLTKGTELEKAVNIFMKAEANGSMLYEALARMAKEQGYIDAAETFQHIAHQEAVHSGFFAVLNGKYPQDFWQLVKGIQKAEAAADSSIQPIIQQFRAMGMNEAANELSVFAEQEKEHGVLLDNLLKKHVPDMADENVDIMAMLAD